MRKFLILSFLALTAGAAGCARGPCGESWRPGYYLFGAGRQNYGYQGYQPTAANCCDPCGGAMTGEMMAPAPMMTQAPCCQ